MQDSSQALAQALAQTLAAIIADRFHEIGAAIIASVAYEGDDTRRRAAGKDLSAWALRLKSAAAPDSPTAMRPDHAFHLIGDIDRILSDFDARLVGADGYMPLLKALHLGDPAPTISLLLERLVSGREDGGELDNVRKRVLAPTRPALHLAAACALVFHARHRAGDDVTGADLLVDRVLVNDVVAEAIGLQPLAQQAIKHWSPPLLLIDF